MDQSGFAGRTGRVHPIRQVGDPVLATPCREVTSFGEDLQALIADMFRSMYEADGVGLAANQIGIDRRVFVYDCPEGEVRRKGVVVNPRLQPLDVGRRSLETDTEGCLSVKGVHADLARPDVATVTGQDPAGTPVRVTGTGFFARCLQHECDHLDGILYVDRLSGRVRRKLLKAYAERQG